jgi:hypothetical protein
MMKQRENHSAEPNHRGCPEEIIARHEEESSGNGGKNSGSGRIKSPMERQRLFGGFLTGRDTKET